MNPNFTKSKMFVDGNGAVRRELDGRVIVNFKLGTSRVVNDGESIANAELFILAQQAVTMLETLVNLHDGLDCGGVGITENDWEPVRKLLGITKNIE